MKKIFFGLMASVVLLTGCLDTTEELTVNEDGSGILTSINDLSAVVGMMKQFAGKELEGKEGMEAKDTLIYFKDIKEKLAEKLSPEEIALVENGQMHVNMDLEKEKMVFELKLPYKNSGQISKISSLVQKVFANQMGEKLGGAEDGDSSGLPPGLGDMKPSSINDYYILNIEKGKVSRVINKEKYAAVGDDQFFSQMKQASAMGIEIKNSYVINLPKPAKKVEGKNAVLSDDKKKVTISSTLDEFLEDAKAFEYSIEY